MGLFKKEPCVLCGGKTGLLDKKCYDGKVCKECAGKLSVWFDNYKGCDRSLLESQIEIRKTDLEMAERMNFNKIFGDHGVILVLTDSSLSRRRTRNSSEVRGPSNRSTTSRISVPTSSVSVW